MIAQIHLSARTTWDEPWSNPHMPVRDLALHMSILLHPQLTVKGTTIKEDVVRSHVDHLALVQN